MSKTALTRLSREIAACTHCAEHLPLGPRPVTVLRPEARLLIIGQAPGTRVYESGIPWDDKSGDRLRDWLGVDRDTFYASPRIAIMPMGFCYPGVAQGKDGKSGGDNPPRPQCAPLWHDRALSLMKGIEVTLLVGIHAQAYYLKGRHKGTMTQAVEKYKEFMPDYWPLPHPSWRTAGWQKRNPWFERDVLPPLRARVGDLLSG